MSQEGKVTSSEAVIRTSVNPGCELFPAAALDQIGEKQLYRLIMQQEYPGEYGIRESMRRRGVKFETNNHANVAAALCKLVAGVFGYPDPHKLLVRDLDVEVPVGGGANLHSSNRQRHRRTQNIIRDAYLRKPNAPHVVIHPTLELPLLKSPSTGENLLRGARLMNPDFMVLIPETNVYMVGDEKSFIVRDDTVVEPSKLDKVRRQVAAGTLAMRHELKNIDPNAPIISEGLFVFASAFGLTAHSMKREAIEGVIWQVEKAIPAMQRAAERLADLRATTGTQQFEALAPSLKTNLREECYGRCIMTDYCESLPENQHAKLGRDAEKFLGGMTPVELQALTANRGSLPAREAALLDSIERSAKVLGLDLISFLQEVA